MTRWTIRLRCGHELYDVGIDVPPDRASNAEWIANTARSAAARAMGWNLSETGVVRVVERVNVKTSPAGATLTRPAGPG